MKKGKKAIDFFLYIIKLIFLGGAAKEKTGEHGQAQQNPHRGAESNGC